MVSNRSQKRGKTVKSSKSFLSRRFDSIMLWENEIERAGAWAEQACSFLCQNRERKNDFAENMDTLLLPMTLKWFLWRFGVFYVSTSDDNTRCSCVLATQILWINMRRWSERQPIFTRAPNVLPLYHLMAIWVLIKINNIGKLLIRWMNSLQILANSIAAYFFR